MLMGSDLQSAFDITYIHSPTYFDSTMFLHVAPCFLIHFSVNWLSLKGVGECVPVSLKGAKETEPDKFRRSACNRAPVSWKEVKEAETSAPDVKPTGSPNYRTLDYQRYVVVLNWTQKIWPDAIRLEFWIAFEIAWSWLHIVRAALNGCRAVLIMLPVAGTLFLCATGYVKKHTMSGTGICCSLQSRESHKVIRS